MNNFQKKTKYKVKFDKGARGLLSSNHIALESNPHPSVLNVGSRVVGKSEALFHESVHLFRTGNNFVLAKTNFFLLCSQLMQI